MRFRELIFGAIATALLVGYLVVGASFYTVVGPVTQPTPTPTVPRGTDVPSTKVPGTIAFALSGEIFVLHEATYRAQTSEGRNQQPTLSADGRQLLFVRNEQIDGQRSVDGQIVNAHLGYSRVVVKPAAGGTETILLDGLRQKAANGFHQVSWYFAPSLSPDGRRLAYIEDDGGGADVAFVDLATKRRTILSNGADLADTAWSPDGKTIATTSYGQDHAAILLWSVDRPGSASRLKTDPDADAYRPAFSPDGKWLLYTLRRDGANDVHVMDLATRSDLAPLDIALTSDGHSWNAVFSPDGRWIAFDREQAGTIDLHAMELGEALSGGSSRPPVKLTRGEGVDGASPPAWAN